MSFESGLDVEVTTCPLGFRYGPGVAGPAPEFRTLDAIRASLYDPKCSGPDPVYAIAMDVARREHRDELERRMLLFGIVTYAAGRLGPEPVRSQGHVHRVSQHSGWRPPELYEIWDGRAVIYMQERAEDDPGRCLAIEAGPGETVVVPPGWAHATISADPGQPLTFAAWCDREYGFEYDAVRRRGGLAWYPLLNGTNGLDWKPNRRYAGRPLIRRRARVYADLGLRADLPIYPQLDRVGWVSRPGRVEWNGFEP